MGFHWAFSSPEIATSLPRFAMTEDIFTLTATLSHQGRGGPSTGSGLSFDGARMSGRGFGPTKVVLEQRLQGFGIRRGPDAADGIAPIVKGVEGAVIEVAQEGMLKAVIRRVGIHQHGTGRVGDVGSGGSVRR